MSTASPNALSPSASPVSATASALRAQNATSAPSSASNAAIRRPSPRVAPVTMAFFPLIPRSMAVPCYRSVASGNGSTPSSTGSLRELSVTATSMNWPTTKIRSMSCAGV